MFPPPCRNKSKLITPYALEKKPVNPNPAIQQAMLATKKDLDAATAAFQTAYQAAVTKYDKSAGGATPTQPFTDWAAQNDLVYVSAQTTLDNANAAYNMELRAYYGVAATDVNNAQDTMFASQQNDPRPG
jgi:hypothetical protein